nr:four helix bundle protein [Pedobacter agri]
MQYQFHLISLKDAGEIIRKTVFSFYIARGSIYEVETQLYLAFDLDFISEIDLMALLEKLETTRKLLNGFIKYYQTLVK